MAPKNALTAMRPTWMWEGRITQGAVIEMAEMQILQEQKSAQA
jgi:hypothetical protein